MQFFYSNHEETYSGNRQSMSKQHRCEDTAILLRGNFCEWFVHWHVVAPQQALILGTRQGSRGMGRGGWRYKLNLQSTHLSKEFLTFLLPANFTRLSFFRKKAFLWNPLGFFAPGHSARMSHKMQRDQRSWIVWADDVCGYGWRRLWLGPSHLELDMGMRTLRHNLIFICTRSLGFAVIFQEQWRCERIVGVCMLIHGFLFSDGSLSHISQLGDRKDAEKI